MAMKVINAKRKKGTFEGNDYDNIVIAVTDSDSKNKQLLFGPDDDKLKIKADDFAFAMGRNSENGFSEVKDMEGAIIVPTYNKYGKVVDFTLYKDETAEK